MSRSRFALVVLSLAAAPLTMAFAQGTRVTVKEEKPGLMAKAKISADSAIALAQLRVPKGKLDAGEIEEEDGKLIYSLVFSTAGKAGVDEVNVDAMTGRIVGVEHESPAAEAKEKAAEAKPKTAGAKPTPKKPPR